MVPKGALTERDFGRILSQRMVVISRHGTAQYIPDNLAKLLSKRGLVTSSGSKLRVFSCSSILVEKPHTIASVIDQ
jgi:hypothetical protein